MIIEVIPIKRLPRGIGDAFSYNVSPELEADIKPGQLVEVDFRNRLIPAVVKTVGKDGNIKGLKQVSKILSPEPIIIPEQMRLARFISNYYFTSLATSIKLFVPDIPKKISNLEFKISKKNKITKKQKIELVWWDNAEDKNKKIISEIKKTIKKNQQVLWLWPEKYLSENAFKKSNINKSLLWQKFTSRKKQLEQYLNILSGKPKLIIGTRSALFAPFNNLGLIILEDEANSLYKSETTPRYHSREVAQELTTQHNAKLILASSAPSLESYISHTNHSELGSGSNIKIIDLKQERRKENYTSLGDELKDAIEKALANKSQVFLYHNRKGFSTSSICKDCGFTFLCPDCQLPLKYHSGSNLLVCHHCRHKQQLPPFCPKCGSGEIKLSGKGSQGLEKELNKLFPKIKIFRIDSDSDITSYQLPVTSYDIVIGTDYALHDNRVDFDNMSVIGVINADQSLYRPDFRASERMYQLLKKFITYNLESKIYIQTYNPGNSVIQAITQNKPELFYAEELGLRKALRYPPYQQVIKLIYRNVNEKKTVGESMHIYNRLRKHLIKNQSKYENSHGRTNTLIIDILKPFPAFERMERGKFKFHLILRISPDAPESLYEKIRQLVPPDWVVDRDPETLL